MRPISARSLPRVQNAMSRNGNRSLSPEFDVFFNGHLVLALPKAFAFLRRVAKPLAAIGLAFFLAKQSQSFGNFGLAALLSDGGKIFAHGRSLPSHLPIIIRLSNPPSLQGTL